MSTPKTRPKSWKARGKKKHADNKMAKVIAQLAKPKKKVEKLPSLHFAIRHYKSGEWVAQCKEVSGIITGGMGKVDPHLIYDAVVCALGYGVVIPKKYLK